MIALTSLDFYALSPLLIVLGGALLLLVVETISSLSSKKFAAYLSLATLGLALYATSISPASTNPLLTPWLSFDALGRLLTSFFLIIGICSTLLSASFFQRFDANEKTTHGEYYFLLLAALFGLMLIGLSADFLTLFLGLETLSIALYILVGYMKKWKISQESAIKYFLMGSLGAAFLLYGIALLYGALGTTRFDALLPAFKGLSSAQSQTLFYSGIALVTLGFAFKAAIVPFHVWAPDVYDGAPTPVTAFMAVGTKVGAFAALIRVFFIALPLFDASWREGIALLAFPTLIYANYVAIRQQQLRRFFAYSGISHAGFMLIPFAVGTPEALSALLFYLIVYAIATLGCFAVLAFLDNSTDGVLLNDLSGLFNRSPFLAGVLALCLMTLAGIPPTVGFFAKFYLFKVAFEAGYYALIVVALLTTILSVYYYMRFVTAMFADRPEQEKAPHVTWPAACVGIVSCTALLVLSCYPALLNLNAR